MHPGESSYWAPEQLCRKFGWGGMFAGRTPDAVTALVEAGGVEALGEGLAGGGRVVGVGGVGGTVAGGLTGTVVVGGAEWLFCDTCPV
ncbi:MAG: hypothetical protein ACRD1G_18265 [Acidimicrobiales bacterium]